MEISDIVASVDIVDYISQFCELEEKPNGELWGLSPLKDENTPSFSVTPEIQQFYDFSSGKGGDILTFIQCYFSCGFMKAVEILKKYANITDDTEQARVVRLQATSVAKRFKPKEQKTRDSTASPLPDDYMDRFPVEDGKLKVWEDCGIGRESLERFQVRYDPFSDRLVFPIRNIHGNIVNISGRTLDPDYKSKKLRKYTYFRSTGTIDTIYGLYENMDEILKKKELILFEGVKSVMLADTWGIKNTGAILTSHLNPNQFRILIKLGVRVVFALDAEVDIRQDANIRRLLPYTVVEWVRNRGGLLGDKDAPVDKGFEVFKTLYEQRRRLR